MTESWGTGGHRGNFFRRKEPRETYDGNRKTREKEKGVGKLLRDKEATFTPSGCMPFRKKGDKSQRNIKNLTG